MQFKKIFGPTRIDSGSAGESVSYDLRGRPGGRMVKVLQYMVKVYTSSGVNCEVGIDVKHGPDGEIYTVLKNGAIPPTAVGSTPQLLVGSLGADDSNAEVPGEWIQPIVTVQKGIGGTGQQFAIVEVWEMRKPF